MSSNQIQINPQSKTIQASTQGTSSASWVTFFVRTYVGGGGWARSRCPNRVRTVVSHVGFRTGMHETGMHACIARSIREIKLATEVLERTHCAPAFALGCWPIYGISFFVRFAQFRCPIICFSAVASFIFKFPCCDANTMPNCSCRAHSLSCATM